MCKEESIGSNLSNTVSDILQYYSYLYCPAKEHNFWKDILKNKAQPCIETL